MSKDMSNWLIVSDIDGTIIDSDGGYMNPRVAEAINKFIGMGGNFTIATGRTHLVVHNVLDRIPVSCPLVVSNGCQIYDSATRRVVHSVPLSDAVKPEALGLLDFSESFGYVAYNEDEMMVYKHSPVLDWLLQYEGSDYVDHSPRQSGQDRWCKGLVAGEVEDIAALYEHCEKIDWASMNARCILSQEHFLEILPAGVSKASGLAKLAELMGIPHEHVCAIGDYYNDAEMIRFAAIGGAVAGAPDEIKAMADVTVGPCREGGVADFIEHIINLA